MATGHLFKKRAVMGVAAVAVALVLVGILVAGCGEVIGAQAGTETLGGSGSLVNVIVVSGTGEVTVAPDEATLQISVENDGATAAAALDANSKDTQKVLDRLKAEGVASKDIETANVVVYPMTYWDDKTDQQRTTSYRAQNTVTVTFTDFELMGDVYAAATEAGADSVYGPNWQLSEDNEATIGALTKAVENARIKAEALAADQGVELGNALVISESSVSVPYPIYAERVATDAAGSSVTPPPLSPQQIEVTASVTVTYPMNR